MPTDTSQARENVAVPPDRVRTVRVSDDLWTAFQVAVLERRVGETTDAWQKRCKDGTSEPLRLAARAYTADPIAFEAACRQIIGEDA